MDPRPQDEMHAYEGRNLLAGQRALITGGDSGIGRAVAVAFAKEGADVSIAYLSEQEDTDARSAHDAAGIRVRHRLDPLPLPLGGIGEYDLAFGDRDVLAPHGGQASVLTGPPRPRPA
jgi:NAD(P)-dependent dehydrogenase (short-subunit alcohol dehydrogenase family)